MKVMISITVICKTAYGTPPKKYPIVTYPDVTPTITATMDGEIWAAWTTLEKGQDRIFYCTLKGDTWSSPQPMSTPFSSNTSPALAVDENQTLWMVWSGYDGEDNEIYFATWEGAQWSSPLRVHTDNTVPDILPEIYMEPSGDLIVRWQSFNGKQYESFFSKWNGADWENLNADPFPDRADNLLSNESDTINSMLDFIPTTAMGTLLIKEHGPLKLESLRHIKEEEINIGNDTDIQQSLSLDAASSSTTIIGFGDSITQGYPYLQSPCNGCTNYGYIPYLKNLFDSISQSVTVRNYGYGGESTSNGVNRINSVLSNNSGAGYTLIMEGTNDYWYGISHQTTVTNLGIMIDKSRQYSIEPIVATITPDTQANGAGKNIPSLNSLIRAKASQKGAQLADQYNACVGNWGDLASPPGDYLHPNNSGYQVIAQTWFNKIPHNQPPQAPTVTTGSAGSITQNSAQIYGTVNPNGQSTSYYFRYGKTTSYGTSTAVNSIGSGTANVSVSATLSGLEPNTTYHYKVVATNAGVGVSGEDRTFKTDPISTPTVATGSAGSITQNSAQIYGTVNPNGQSTSYYFRYGKTTSYGTSTAVNSIGSGTANVSVSATLSGLEPNTTYHYKVVATNAGGGVSGEDRTLKTLALPPTILDDGAAASATSNTATINGNYNPNGSSSQYYFQYGTTPGYGSKTTVRDGGSGTTTISVSEGIARA